MEDGYIKTVNTSMSSITTVRVGKITFGSISLSYASFRMEQFTCALG